MVITEQYETKKAYTSVILEDKEYMVDYIIKSPLEETPFAVDASLYVKTDGDRQRVGYASYSEGTSSFRLENSVPVSVQSSLSVQFFIDLKEILG